MEDKITIDKLDLSEWQKYKELRLKALKGDSIAFGTTYEEEVESADEKWQQRLQDSLEEKNSITVFALDDKKPVGMMTAYWDSKNKTRHVVAIVGVYVDNNYRGKGIASKLLEDLIKRIKSNRQFRKIRLQVAAYNEPAKKLYEKHGFKEVGFLKEELFAEDKYWDDILMELYL